MKRRSFLRSGTQAFIASPLLFSSPYFFSKRAVGSPIVTVFDDRASILSSAPGKMPNDDRVIVDLINTFTVDRTRVSNMMDKAVMHLTGESMVGKAWESLFPEGKLNLKTKVCIKINLSYGEHTEENNWNSTSCPFGPKVALSDAIVFGLTQMLEGHFPAENITIFDTIYSGGSRQQYPLVQGYRPVKGNSDEFYIDQTPGTYSIHWVNPRNKREVPEDAPAFTAAPEYSTEYQAHQRVKPVVYESDFMINVAIAKDHREAGVTGVMKNNYGCTDNPMGTHGSTWRRMDSPYPGTRLCVPVFYKSLNEITPCILNIMDALVGVYHGGPLAGKVFHANQLSVSKDPLAIDTHLLNMINVVRKKNGYAAITTHDGKNEDGHLNASFLRITEERHEIGNASQDNLELLDLSQQPAIYKLTSFDKPQSRVSDVYAIDNALQLDIALDDSQRKHTIDSWVEDLEQNVVKKLRTQTTAGSAAQLSWKPRLNRKKRALHPRYAWHTEIDGVRHTRIVTV